MRGQDENDPLPGAQPPSDGGPRNDPFAGKAKMVVRLAAGGFLFIGGLNLALYFVECHHNQTEVSVLRCLWLSIPLVIGVAILVKTSALAGRIDDWLEQ